MAKDPDEKTHLGSNLPPLPKLPGQKPAPTAEEKPAEEKPAEDEETRFGGTKVPQKSALDRLIEERTSLGQGPPPMPRKREPAAPPAAGAAAHPAPAAAGGDDRTVVARHTPKAKARLQRVAPPGRSGVVSLTRTTYVLGRSNTADVPLFSGTASRQHAKLTNHDGKWFIEPLESKLVKANGAPVTAPTRLMHKMHVQLGEDELIFMDESAPAAPERTAKTEETATEEGGPSLLRILVIALVMVFAAFLVMSILGQ